MFSSLSSWYSGKFMFSSIKRKPRLRHRRMSASGVSFSTRVGIPNAMGSMGRLLSKNGIKGPAFCGALLQAADHFQEFKIESADIMPVEKTALQ